MICVPTITEYREKAPHPARVGGGRGLRDESSVSADGSGPLVSVITIARNAGATIQQTIESILAQTYPNIEYIVIDGASTDETLNITRRYEHRIDYWLSEPDEGIADAFNKGIALATGEIIGIINADDWYNEDAVRHAVEQFRQSQADIVYGNLQLWDKDMKTELFFADHKQIEIEMTINHPSVFVRRTAYEEIGLFRADFRYAMDYEWLLRAKHHGLRFHYINYVFTNMRLSGLSNRYWKQTEWEAAKARKLYAPGKSHYPFFLFQIAKGTARRFFERIHLHALVEFYHRHISRVKKIKA